MIIESYLFGQGRDSQTIELDGSRLDLRCLLGAIRQSLNVIKLLAEGLGSALGLVGALSGISNDAANTTNCQLMTFQEA